MKKLVIMAMSAILFGQADLKPFEFNTSLRIINDTQWIYVQVTNNSQRTIAFLEGFASIRRPDGKISSEIRITLVPENEQALPHGAVRSKSVKYHHDSGEFHQVDFQVSKLKFSEDYRHFTWHPSVGFIRID